MGFALRPSLRRPPACEARHNLRASVLDFSEQLQLPPRCNLRRHPIRVREIRASSVGSGESQVSQTWNARHNLRALRFGSTEQLQLPPRSNLWRHPIRARGIRASSVGSGESQDLEALRKMRAGAIKQELDALGVSYRDCFEKDELVNRLASERKRTRVPPVDLTRIPMRKLKSTAASPKEYIIIPVTFGSHGTFDFLLDTGSSITLVSPYIAHSKLGIPAGSGQLSRVLGGMMGDDSFDRRRVSLPAMTIAGKSCKPVEGIIVDIASTGLPPSVCGIVGLNVLSQFDVEFDFLKEQISFFEVGAVDRGHCNKEGLQKLAVAPVSFSLPGIQVDMGGGNVQTALIDLGSSLSVTTPQIAKRSGATLEKSALSVVGLGGQQMVFSRACIDVTLFREQNSMSSEKLVLRKVAFAVGELPVMQAIKCSIILGLNVFSRTRLILCMSSKTAYLQTFV